MMPNKRLAWGMGEGDLIVKTIVTVLLFSFSEKYSLVGNVWCLFSLVLLEKFLPVIYLMSQSYWRSSRSLNGQQDCSRNGQIPAAAAMLQMMDVQDDL